MTSSTREAMSSVVLSQLGERVAEFEVVIPLFNVELPIPITVGRVTMRNVTRGDFARWEAATTDTLQESSAVSARRQAIFASWKGREGLGAAFLSIVGERERVVQVALEEAERAAALLRLFSPAMLSPHGRSFCTPLGRERLETSTYLSVDSAGGKLEVGDHVLHADDLIWRLDADRIRLIREEVLDVVAQKVFATTSIGFSVEVRTALILYSQAALKKSPTDKLLAVLLPLEAFLRRDDKESIVEPLALRMAFAIGETREERKEVAKVTKAAYSLRSRFVHHGRAVNGTEDIEVVRQFMSFAWRFFITLGVQVVSDFPDRESYLAALDDRKFGLDP